MDHRGEYRAEADAKHEQGYRAHILRDREEHDYRYGHHHMAHEYHPLITGPITEEPAEYPADGYPPEQHSGALGRKALGEAPGADEEGRAPEHRRILDRAVGEEAEEGGYRALLPHRLSGRHHVLLIH